MALLYDQFGIRSFELMVNIWPGVDQFAPGELSRLYGHLNTDDEFQSCDLRLNQGARFEGDDWVYDIAPSSILIRCTGYPSTDALRRRIRRLLAQTRAFFAAQHYVAYYVENIRAFGSVPEDKDRNIGEVVQKRLLQRVKAEELEGLPGLAGAGLQLVGNAEEPQRFHWHARIEPPHGSYGVLGISADLMFPLAPEPPTEDDDLDDILRQVDAAYAFITDDVTTFASKLFH